jgi:hypothetical protein
MAYTTINKPTEHFNGATYLGSASAVTVSSLSFQPDLVWIKDRQNANNHCLVDAVRGVGKYLGSNLATAEVNSTSQSISSFTATGFVTGTANPANEAGSSSTGFISWNWKANGAGVANTAGTISSTVSANTTSGFSIVTWTGNGSSSATVGHGLSVAPEMILVKARAGTNAANNWFIYHKNLSANNNLIFTSAGQLGTGSYSSGVVATPTSSTIGFTAGSSVVNVNESGTTFVAYCFASIKAFSKIGAYTGNGSNDGTFVYTGFKPAFVMIKKYSTTGEDWFLWDNKRATFNVAEEVMRPNSTSIETDVVYDGMDILSNGFKLRYNDTRSNGSGLGYIYMAFAEQPLVGTNNVPATAR